MLLAKRQYNSCTLYVPSKLSRDSDYLCLPNLWLYFFWKSLCGVVFIDCRSTGNEMKSQERLKNARKYCAAKLVAVTLLLLNKYGALLHFLGIRSQHLWFLCVAKVQLERREAWSRHSLTLPICCQWLENVLEDALHHILLPIIVWHIMAHWMTLSRNDVKIDSSLSVWSPYLSKRKLVRHSERYDFNVMENFSHSRSEKTWL